ncbi:MAG: AAA family ATPase [Bifidobacterium aquikefiri]|uniref:DNA topology modulation protein FlaR n=1 Tax=Bifidobacterium aquikefiri TaxID=1653207 RepID=A0A261G7R0_9BIFI|nr:AAA family ATPase [Bifidobacterium aquikefiri]OZG67215.1 DNA topology modulation protein FlaR [Bifidobacterium aquikefiri]
MTTIAKEAKRIAILGYSGSGKSTLARKLASDRSLPLVYLDTLHWLPHWQERSHDEASAMMDEFLDTHNSWVIEGNYRNISFERRMNEADCIIILNVNRLICLRRVLLRRLKYRNTNRPDMTVGCNDKIDAEFLAWLLWRGRSRSRAALYRSLAHRFQGKCVTL